MPAWALSAVAAWAERAAWTGSLAVLVAGRAAGSSVPLASPAVSSAVEDGFVASGLGPASLPAVTGAETGVLPPVWIGAVWIGAVWSGTAWTGAGAVVAVTGVMPAGDGAIWGSAASGAPGLAVAGVPAAGVLPASASVPPAVSVPPVTETGAAVSTGAGAAGRRMASSPFCVKGVSGAGEPVPARSMLVLSGLLLRTERILA